MIIYRIILITVMVCGASCSAPLPVPPATDLDAGYRLVSPPAAPDSAAAAERLKAIENIPDSLFMAAQFEAANNVTLPYRLLPPQNVQPGTRYPLVVVFHGAGEIGVDNARHLDRFPKAWARPEIRAAYPAYVLAPQMPERSAVYSGPAGDSGRYSMPAPPLYAALDLIDALLETLPIDTTRVYAIGFSMGASTVWNAINLRPTLFAAAIPIAGVPNPAHRDGVARTPLWIIHGNADTANPIEQDRAMYALLRAVPGAQVQFSEFDQGVHQVPPMLATSDAFAAWLFRHRR